jgi:8-oxo-dGTP diphosphatase
VAKGPYTYAYPRPMVTVDAVVFSESAGRREVLLIERARDPFAGSWALPGGFVDIDEALDTAAHRELEEETGLRGIALAQVHAFGDPDRDPRGRSISIAFAGITDRHAQKAAGADDAADARWFPLDELPPLAFDHADILAYAVARMFPEKKA